MKRAGYVFLIATAIVVSPLRITAEPYKDVLCPAAAQSVTDFNAANVANDSSKTAAAARRAIDAYAGCAMNALSVGNIEPAVNYDHVRMAQFEYALAKVLAESGKDDEVVPHLQNARKLADEVATWVPSATNYINSNHAGVTGSGRNGNRSGSNYQQNAITIRDAADGVLRRLGAAATPNPSSTP
ncbi:MAG TPA: hypothetical protein VE591_10065 [Candidatus Acidoferrum sp.]|nr:hypothetical protein [Candidatus Acidoferrum sp.]